MVAMVFKGGEMLRTAGKLPSRASSLRNDRRDAQKPTLQS